LLALNFRGSHISKRQAGRTALAPALESSSCSPCLAFREANPNLLRQTETVHFCTPKKLSR
jgi:hypothetical protein